MPKPRPIVVGEGTDITEELATLASVSATEKQIRGAIALLETKLADQGIAGDGAVEAVAHLIEILRGKPTRIAQAKALGLLASWADPLATEGADHLVDECARAGEAAIELLASPDAAVRAQAARLLGRSRDAKLGGVLAKRIVGERDPVVRAALIFGATRHGRNIARGFLTNADPLIAAAAALGRVARDAKTLDDPDVRRVVAAAAKDKRLARTALGDLRFAAEQALREEAMQPSPPEDDTRRRLLAVICSDERYRPAALVKHLSKLPDARRIDVAMTLVRDSELAKHWGGNHVGNSSKTNNRRRARALDVMYRLLRDVDDAKRLDVEIAALAVTAWPDRALVAIARARIAARAGKKIPSGTLAIITANPSSYWCGCEPWVRDICCDGLVKKSDGTLLWELADLSPLALKRLVAEEKKDYFGFGPDRLQLLRVIAAYDRKALEPLMTELAKRTKGRAEPVTWNGLLIKTNDYTSTLDELD
jgi:hypothetical protein